MKTVVGIETLERSETLARAGVVAMGCRHGCALGDGLARVPRIIVEYCECR